MYMSLIFRNLVIFKTLSLNHKTYNLCTKLVHTKLVPLTRWGNYLLIQTYQVEY